MKKYNFLFATDAKFGWLLPLVLSSIFDNANNVQCRVFIYYSSMHDKDKNNIKLVAEHYNQEVVFKKFNVKAAMDAHNLQDAPAWFGSFDAYTRIFAVEDLYQQGIDKCIYLDCDVLVLQSLESLFHIYDEMQTIGGLAGRDPNSHNKFMTDNYLNSGVLVMNLIYLHNVNFMDKCISFLK